MNNKTIIITGGTGSFGNEFTSLLLKKYKPKKIIIFSRDEFKQHNMQKKFDNPILRFFIGDVRDLSRLDFAMREVDYVVHAAALKHVPIAEYNPLECIKTNINGAANIITAALKNNVEKVIALSTDKAASPINLYGATKLCSDKLFIAANNFSGGHKTKFSIVRYGNVAGSRGSVNEIFLKYLKEDRGYFPITDKKMTRFWIKLSQGVNFTTSCFDKMIGGEIFVPKIPSIKITDLAKSFNKNFKIKVIGLRPGEKIHEVMISREDTGNVVEYKNFYILKPVINTGFSRKLDQNKFFNLKGSGKGKLLKEEFEYSSGTNKVFLTVDELKKFD